MKLFPTLASLLALGSVPAFADAPLFRDPAKPVDERVADLLQQLTLEEKISQLKMDSPAIPRLDIPAYHWWNEGLHGYARSGVATVFPQAIGLAAMWDADLQEKIGEVVSVEARAKYNEARKANNGRTRIYEGITIWSPNINIFRDPRWGRGQETYGEDPFLTGTLGAAFVRGIQGKDTMHPRAVATLKHFAVHSGPEAQRHVFDAVPSSQDFRETYLPAFEMGIREGGALSVMSVYNSIYGVPGPANTLTLDRILRGEWGFTGAVVSDVDAVADISDTHKFAPDYAHGGALALKAGNDLCSGWAYNTLGDAVKQGLVDEATINRSFTRLLRLRFLLGQFDPAGSGPYDQISAQDIATPEHSEMALQAALRSMVLLKNDGTLPLQVERTKTVALIGPSAADTDVILGNYAGTPAKMVTLKDGLTAAFEAKNLRVVYAAGAPYVTGHKPQVALPETVLSHGKGEPGLLLEVFNNANLEGKAETIMIDSTLERQWGFYGLAPGIPEKNAGLRWLGKITAPEDGEFDFVLHATGVAIAKIDDVLLQTDAHTPKGDVHQKMTLVKDREYLLTIEFHQGDAPMNDVSLKWIPPARTDSVELAVAAAKQADQVVLFLGNTPGLEGEEMPVALPGFEGGDRTSIMLPESQQKLLEAVHAVGKPVTVVLTTGSPVAFDIQKANAVLCAWYPGERGAEALAKLLLGEENPSGKLPLTFYASDKDLPAFNDYSMAKRGYRYFKGTPQFAFGYGLSYTRFAFEKATLSQATAKPEASVTLTVEVKNTGTRTGETVVEVYGKREQVTESLKRRLVGFKRLALAPGQSLPVTIEIPLSRLRRWSDKAQAYVVPKGHYSLEIGSASDDLPLTAELTVE